MGGELFDGNLAFYGSLRWNRAFSYLNDAQKENQYDNSKQQKPTPERGGKQISATQKQEARLRSWNPDLRRQ